MISTCASALARSCGRKARTVSAVPTTFVWTSQANSSRVIASKRAMRCTPTFAASRSQPPNAFAVVSASAASDAASPTSTRAATAFAPDASSERATSAAPSSAMSATTTRMPSAANSRAIAAPRPEAPPVTTAVLSAKRFTGSHIASV